jgi:hypothetical protein
VKINATPSLKKRKAFARSKDYGKICIFCHLGRHKECRENLLVNLGEGWKVLKCQCQPEHR